VSEIIFSKKKNNLRHLPCSPSGLGSYRLQPDWLALCVIPAKAGIHEKIISDTMPVPEKRLELLR